MGTELVARTAAVPDPGPLVSLVGDDDFAWFGDETAFVARGTVAELEATDAHERLAEIGVEDTVGSPGTGPIAVGALPFDRTARPRLRVPAEVVGRVGGVAWRTTISARDGTDAAADPISPRPPGERPRPTAVRERPDRAGWRSIVLSALTQIRRGDLAKVVLAREVDVELAAPPSLPELLERLGDRGRFVFAARGLVGASPELLVRRRARTIVAQPMAGSVPRTGDVDEDADRALRLVRSGKDRAEHQVVVDAVVDAFGDWCHDVDVADEPELVTLSSITHLATTIRGRLRDDAPSALAIARVLHPTPAVGGTPRDAATALLRLLEPFDRGPYAGPVGWVDASGDGEFAVALRCGIVDGTTVRCFAGAGIVAGSDPDREWEETEAKLTPMLTALGALTPSRSPA